MFSNEDKRRERSLLVQKKNIKFEKKKPIKLKRLKFEPANLTEYHTSQGRKPLENKYDSTPSGVVNLR